MDKEGQTEQEIIWQATNLCLEIRINSLDVYRLPMKLFRQGDVLLREIASLPKEAKETDERVLARGEVTGHSHRLEGDTRQFISNNGQILIQVGQDAKLVHEEHGVIDIPQGIYEVIRQREYNPIQDRVVQD